jgi:hypothetical protein
VSFPRVCLFCSSFHSQSPLSFFEFQSNMKPHRSFVCFLYLFLVVQYALSDLLASSRVERCVLDGTNANPDDQQLNCRQKMIVTLSLTSGQVKLLKTSFNCVNIECRRSLSLSLFLILSDSFSHSFTFVDVFV